MIPWQILEYDTWHNNNNHQQPITKQKQQIFTPVVMQITSYHYHTISSFKVPHWLKLYDSYNDF